MVASSHQSLLVKLLIQSPCPIRDINRPFDWFRYTVVDVLDVSRVYVKDLFASVAGLFFHPSPVHPSFNFWHNVLPSCQAYIPSKMTRVFFWVSLGLLLFTCNKV